MRLLVAGAPNDGGTPPASDASDATAGDTGSDSGPVFTCPPGAILCDDFERGAIETGPWVLFAGSVMGTISTKHAKSPTRSAAVTYDPAKGFVIYQTTIDLGPGSSSCPSISSSRRPSPTAMSRSSRRPSAR